MSRIKLQGNPGGTGTLTLASPDTNSDFTLNLPAVSGTLSAIATVTNNGVLYVNGSGQPTSGSALTFDGTNLEVTGDISGTWTSGATRFVGSQFLTGSAYQLGMKTTMDTRETQIFAKAADTGGYVTIATGITPTERVRVDGSGNVGIGTSSPTVRLQTFTSGVSTQAFFESGTGASVIRFKDSTTTDTFAPQFGSAGNSLFWQIAGSEQMRLTSTGLGIGTSSPTGRIGIGLQSYTASATNGMIRFQNDQNTADGCIQAYSVNPSVGTDMVIGSNFYINTSGSFVRFNTSIASSFQTVSRDGTIYWGTGGTGATATERMKLDSSGNLQLGLTGGSARLNVSYAYPTTGANWFSDSAATHYAITFNNSNGLVGNISTSASSTSYNTSSDYRLKHDIQPMTGALAKVQQLKPVTYKWNVDDSAGEGFIAHELAEVVPGCVTGEKDAVDADGKPQYQGIDVSFLVGTLTAAIQELKAIVDAQGAEIAALKGQV